MLAFYVMGIGFIKITSKLRGPIDEVALGFGDVNLSCVIGLILGWPGIGAGLIITLLLSGIISLIYILYKIARKQYRPDLALPFGPFLVASAVFLIYLKDTIYWIWSWI